MADFDKEILKKIEIQQKFADFIYKDFRSKRFGISPCCSIDQMNKFTIKSELCNQPEKLKTYSNTSYEKELWDITMFEEPLWLEGSCPNGCTYPPIFEPNEEQLGNIGGSYYWGIEEYADWTNPIAPESSIRPGGINVAVKVLTSSLTSNIPNTSGNAQVTIYQEIHSDQVLQMLQGYTNTPGWPNPGITNVWDDYAQPAGNFPANGITIEIPIAQFYIRQSPQGVMSPHFLYNDPIFAFAGAGGATWITASTTTDNDGNTLYYLTGDGDFTFRFTLFGNTSKDFSTFNLNGGVYIRENMDPSPLKIKVKDGGDLYYGELAPSFLSGFPDPTIFWLTDGNPSDAYGNFSDLVPGGNYTGAPNTYTPPDLEEPDLICSFGFPGGTQIFEDGELVSQTPCVLCGFESSDVPYDGCDYNWQILYEELLDWSIYLPVGYEPAPNQESLCELCAILRESDPNGLLNVTINIQGGFTGTGAELCQCCDPSPEVNIACPNDSECIRIEVLNQNGDPIEGYDIIIDGGNAGVTNENGVFTTTINNASVNTDHTLNICYCFTTTGNCSQQKITIILTDDCITECNITKAECTDIEEASEE